MQKNRDDYVFFWGGIYSNWYISEFTWNNIKFNCAEQAMMWAKAALFGDRESCQKILAEKNPRNQKALGREIKNYDDARWAEARLKIVTDIVYAKFSQNPDLKKEILATEYKTLVEASPLDKIWGIGMAEGHPDILDESKWNGQNLLGKALMEARNWLK